MPKDRTVTHSVRTFKHVTVDVVLPRNDSSVPEAASAIVLRLSGRAPVVLTPSDFQEFCNCVADTHERIFGGDRPLYVVDPDDEK